MHVSPQIVRAFDLCLDAVIGLSDWPLALQQLGRSLGADSSVLMSVGQDFSARHRTQIESSEHAGFSNLWLARLENPLSDPHSTRARRYPIAQCPCVTDHHITSDEERANLLYFNEIARPGEREWWALLRTETDQGAWGLNLYRSKRAGPYGPEEALRTGHAAPLLRRLTATAERFARTGWDARLHSFDQLRLAAFLVDRGARVQGMNAAAESLLGQGFGLHSARGRLFLKEPKANAAFGRFLREIAAGTELPGPLVLFQDNNQRWLVEFIPVAGYAVEVFSGAKGLILVSDMSGPQTMRLGMLQQAFGLTRAEERFALALADGQGLGPAADRLGIGYETARSHLHAVFDKTDTHSQAQLSALLTRVAERMLTAAPPPNG